MLIRVDHLEVSWVYIMETTSELVWRPSSSQQVRLDALGSTQGLLDALKDEVI